MPIETPAALFNRALGLVWARQGLALATLLVGGLLTILIITFYLLVEAGTLRKFLLQLFPVRNRARVDVVSRSITHRTTRAQKKPA